MDPRSGMFHLDVSTAAPLDLIHPRLSVYSMSKGDKLLIPIYAMNTDKDIWGNDAFEFKSVFNQELLFFVIGPDSRCNARPERWQSPPESISENPGVWSNLMTFLGGPRACIGYQFTLIESVHHLRFLHISVEVLTTSTPQDEMPFVCAHSKVRVRVGPPSREYRMAEPGGG